MLPSLPIMHKPHAETYLEIKITSLLRMLKKESFVNLAGDLSKIFVKYEEVMPIEMFISCLLVGWIYLPKKKKRIWSRIKHRKIDMLLKFYIMQ